MSDERETTAVPDPGAPIEEGAASETAVQDAVERASSINDGGGPTTAGPTTAGPSEAGIPLDAASTDAPLTGDSRAGGVLGDADAAAASAAEQAHRVEVSQIDTHLNLEQPPQQDRVLITERVETPSAAADQAAVVADSPARDGEIRISADHPMAALYMQSPMPPDLKGNRGAGVFIALLATLAFAVVYAAIIAVWLAPTYPPSTFLTGGLLPWVTSWGFIAGVVAFFIGLVILVMIFGRAGWWAYVIFSLFVGVLVWLATAGTFALTGNPLASVTELRQQFGVSGGRIDATVELMKHLAFMVPTLGAAVAAREVAVWFGAWIGRRGRKVTARNAALMKEYDAALAEVRAQQ